MTTRSRFDPRRIAQEKKAAHLLSLTEDKFRDRVVRRIFFDKGFRDGRELCGPDEEGKDTIFVHPDPLSGDQIYAIQTKRGNLKLSREASQNAVVAKTQLATALETSCFVGGVRRKPDFAALVISGRINAKARRFITEDLDETKVKFFDADDVIPWIDELMPEFWYGIDTQRLPYLRSVIENLEQEKDPFFVKASIDGDEDASEVPSCVGEGHYVTLRVNRPVYVPGRKIPADKVGAKEVKQIKIEEHAVARLLSKPDRLLLLSGEAGSGKSTALRRIAYDIARRGLEKPADPTIPILLRAQAIVGMSGTLVDLCQQTAGAQVAQGESCFSTEDLAEGRVLLLVDGVDEIASPESRAQILEVLRDFRRRYPTCVVVAATRPDSQLNARAVDLGFTVYNISPISHTQASKIIHRVMRSGSEKTIKEVLRRLEEVHGIELTPLLVTVFASTSEFHRSDIPANITELFKKYTELMLGRWDETKGLSLQHQNVVKDFVLRKLAFRMMSDGVTQLSLGECKRLINNLLTRKGYKGEAASIFDEAVHKSNLFRILGDAVEFRHHLIQEFFSGRAMTEADVLAHASDPWWRNGIVFYFGEHHEDAHALRKLNTTIGGLQGDAHFNAVVAFGLALQAAYLVDLDDRSEIYGSVVQHISRSYEAYRNELDSAGVPRPLVRLVGLYLHGRDAVACSVLKQDFERVREKVLSGTDTSSHELREFWLIVGLIECGDLKRAYERVCDFHPSDNRLLLAIHLGAFLVSHKATAGRSARKNAKRIWVRLAPRIESFRRQVIEEWESEILELRRGEIKAVPVTVKRRSKRKRLKKGR